MQIDRAALYEKYKDIESSWQHAVERSAYHFRTDVIDPRWDTVIGIGRFAGDFSEDVEQIIANMRPATIAGRRPDSKPSLMMQAELNDYQKAGIEDPANHVLYQVCDVLPTKVQQMVNCFALAEGYTARIHCQMPGEMFPNHLDKFDMNTPDIDPNELIRIVVMLTDYVLGHFYSYGNYIYQNWRAGDIHTFAYRHVPHATANASLLPRVGLFVTGQITDSTRKFFLSAANTSEIEL